MEAQIPMVASLLIHGILIVVQPHNIGNSSGGLAESSLVKEFHDLRKASFVLFCKTEKTTSFSTPFKVIEPTSARETAWFLDYTHTRQ